MNFLEEIDGEGPSFAKASAGSARRTADKLRPPHRRRVNFLLSWFDQAHHRQGYGGQVATRGNGVIVGAGV
ncbi:MAG: hypothetical protein JSW23_08325 [Planctomycetota bacterium]|nr:MAG: hypothetical protein JSW23_08325 [Planctomycetota bacterium]